MWSNIIAAAAVVVSLFSLFVSVSVSETQTQLEGEITAQTAILSSVGTCISWADFVVRQHARHVPPRRIDRMGFALGRVARAPGAPVAPPILCGSARAIIQARDTNTPLLQLPVATPTPT